MMKKYRINGKEYVAMDELLPDIASLIPMLTSNSRNHRELPTAYVLTDVEAGAFSRDFR